MRVNESHSRVTYPLYKGIPSEKGSKGGRWHYIKYYQTYWFCQKTVHFSHCLEKPSGNRICGITMQQILLSVEDQFS